MLVIQKSRAAHMFLIARQFVQNGPHWRHFAVVGDVPRCREQVVGRFMATFDEIVNGLLAFARFGEQFVGQVAVHVGQSCPHSLPGHDTGAESTWMVLMVCFCSLAACRIARAKIADSRAIPTIAARSQLGVTRIHSCTWRGSCTSATNASMAGMPLCGDFDGGFAVVDIRVSLRCDQVRRGSPRFGEGLPGSARVSRPQVRRGSPDPAETFDRRSPRSPGDLRFGGVARSKTGHNR